MHTKPIADRNLFELINNIIGISHHALAAHQFWFIRDLIVAAIFSPAFKLLADRVGVYPLIILIPAWILKLPSGYVFSSYDAPLFFYIGTLLAKHDAGLVFIDRFGKISLFIFPLLAVTGTIALSFKLNAQLSIIATQTAIFFGVFSYWHASSYLPQRPENLLARLSKYSFFLFAAHDPALFLTMKLCYIKLHPTGFVPLAAYYLLIPAIEIFFVLCVGFVIGKTLPRFYGVITGGRQ